MTGETPLMVAWRLQDRLVLIVGGGKIAGDRLASAMGAGARVRILSPTLSPALSDAYLQGAFEWIPDVWSVAHLDDDIEMVLSAIDNDAVSARIAEACRSRRIPVNIADRPEQCDFWFASIHKQGPLQIAVSTSGAGPAIAGRLREHLAACLPAQILEALARFSTLRRAIRVVDPKPSSSGRRMRWLKHIGRQWQWSSLARLEPSSLVRHYLAGRPPPSDQPDDDPGGGRVILIGAGPGDPGLLTVAGRAALSEADLVLCDRLVSPEIRALVSGELRIARKLPGRSAAAQEELNTWMVTAAQAGRVVVRLKCGDPFLFGRGAEEIAVLEAAGVPVEVIPGVTSALSGPLLAGIPATCRGIADRVVISTGKGSGGRWVGPPDFRPDTTAIFLMAVGRLPALAEAMQAKGWPASWPAAAIERASHPGQRVLRGTLKDLPQIAADANLAPPAIILVGRVASIASEAALREAV